jgi:hypothetical protein
MAEAVSTVSVSTTSTSMKRQMNARSRLAISAPGSMPASHSTWNPLQIPTTGAPASAMRPTSAITGEKRAMAPVRR